MQEVQEIYKLETNRNIRLCSLKRAHCRTLLKVPWSLPLGASLGALLSNSRHQTKLLFGTGPNQSWDTFFLISLILSVMILYTPPGVIFRLVHPRAQLKTRPLINILKILFQYPVVLSFYLFKVFFCHNHGLWLTNEDFTICVCMYRFCLQRVSMSFSSEVTIFF